MIQRLVSATGAFLFVCASLLAQQDSGGDTASSDRFIDGVSNGEIVLKGAMVSLTGGDEEQMKTEILRLKNEYGANIVRLGTWPFDGLTPQESASYGAKLPKSWRSPEEWYKTHPWEITGAPLKERWLPFFKANGLAVILNLDAGVGDFLANAERTRDVSHFKGYCGWTDPDFVERYVDYVAEKARFFSDQDAVIGYDVLNEPIPPGSYEDAKLGGWKWDPEKAEAEMPGGSHVLSDLYNEIIVRIRAFDSRRFIVVQPGPWGQAAGFPQLLNIIPDKRLIFSFHMYSPGRFTTNNMGPWHDHRFDRYKEPVPYPYHEDGITFDKAYMEAAYRPAAEFQTERSRRTGLPCVIWIGELGTVRWADSDSQRLWYNDTFSILNAHRWGWAYFLFAPWATYWHVFGPYGPEGKDLDVKTYFDRYANGESSATDYFRLLNQQGPRPSFKIVIDQMKSSDASPQN